MYNLFSFYRCPEWEAFRQVVIADRINEVGDTICEYCGKPIVHKYDCILHHKEALTEGNVNDVNISLNPDNIQLVHRQCHNRIHERFGFAPSKKTYIIWGSPCAGKRSYVDMCAGKNDLIIDIDRLYEAMSNTRSKAITGNVLQIYRSLIDMVHTHNGKWYNAWIVRTLPLKIDRELIVKEIGSNCELIYIDTPKEECINEALNRGGDWKVWVDEYWNRLQL